MMTTTLALLLLAASGFQGAQERSLKPGAVPAPTEANTRYDSKHERNVLDFWRAPSDRPTPLVVWFHGGGFTQGDKKSIVDRDNVVGGLLARGISVAACNYPFKKDADYEEILIHCGRAIQFLRSKAREWNLDPARIGAAGASAGALISEWLGYHEDLAQPGSADPVARMSSAVAAVGGVQQPMGTEELILPHLRAGGPPLFLYTTAPETDPVHHPKYAKLLRAKVEGLKIPVEIYGGPRNDLPAPPAGETYARLLIRFFTKAFGIKSGN